MVKIDTATTSADLTVGKTASPDPATAGLPLTYTLTVTNNGPNPATGVRLIDQMPAGSLSVSSATPSQGTCTVVSAFFLEVRCALGSLAAAANATATIVVTPLASGTITNTATLASSVSDPNGANNAATRDTVVILPPPPTITNFTPSAGAVDTSVTITGENLATASFLTFNGTSAAFSAVSDTQITAIVPFGATTGPISATTLSGTATSATDFTVGLPPTITSISPTSGAVGVNVTINGTNLAGATSVTFNGTSASYTINTGTRITAIVPADATTGPIRVTTPTATAASASNFTVAPRITGFTPPSGAPGTSVAIAGANFTGATSVRFNGIAAAFNVDQPTQITATVPANAKTGEIVVTTSPGGTATSAASFVVAPRITSFTPSTGTAGTSVAINSANFAGASSVTFNGTAAAFTVNTPVKITATVPAGVTTGVIAVTTVAGTATSATTFTVSLMPAISAFSPGSGGIGASVAITGTNLNSATSVKLNGLKAPFTVDSDTQITMTVPGKATTGPITVRTPSGMATSVSSFTVAPRITSLIPASGVIGSSVTINGANFTGATSVRLNGTAASFNIVSPIKIKATVPAGATTGKIAVTTPAGTTTSVGSFTVKP